MHHQNVLALNSKLSLLTPSKKAHLISYLPDHLKKALADETFPEKTVPVSLTIEKLTRRIDISHFKEFLKTLPANEQKVFISAFPKYKQVQLSDEPTTFGEFTAEGLSNTVLKMLFEKVLKGFPPPVYLPFHPILEILGDTGIALIKLVHYLGLYDVAMELKTIISRKTLKTLQSAFDAEEISFLNIASNKEGGKLLSPIHLEEYNGDEKELREYILERGIYRFAQGIHNAPIEYHFFITYFLPVKIGEKVNSLLKNRHTLPVDYNNWESDILITWRFLCTYSQ